MKDLEIIFEKNNETVSKYTFYTERKEKELLGNFPENLLRKDEFNLFPNISENVVVRHFIDLSNRNYGVDTNFYPLGSCTMKYNPKINEKIAKLPEFLNFHPYSNQERVQGILEILYKCKEALLEITGMDDLTLAPCAGAHGEQTGLYVIKAYFLSKGEKRKKVLIPDSAHGTNPASAKVSGFEAITLKSDKDGFIDLNDLKNKVNSDVAALMLTNPNTLGLFEKKIDEVVKICKDFDIKLYYDGANLNAILGIVRPGDMGFDVVHINLHKTFSTPHGTGGPGAGPVAVKKELAPFLPQEDIKYLLNYTLVKRESRSIGKIRAFYCNFLVVLKAYVYIYTLGKEGLQQSAMIALLNANYLAKLLENDFDVVTKDHVMHEFVISLNNICKMYDISVIDFAKRILDYNFHAPTVSFPLIVSDCLMIEPTETESKKTLDEFAECIKNILNEVKKSSEILKKAPCTKCIKRVDDVRAARLPILKYNFENN